ncbi:MAG: TIGR04282 family arsenosugar biosynthesis glycosyltransferase [Acidobacteria bacterium]|nr:TIGR04282 family arsenosugar biosynthesis glycosyltransferase [Acidobacteriota bacterium]
MFPTTTRGRQKLLVFARYPELGRVKTRLASELGCERTLAAYRAMLADLLDAIGESDAATEVEVMWTASREVTGDLLRTCFGSRQLAMQAGSSLGDRLSISFAERIFFHEASKVIAVGTDEPLLDRTLVDHAFALLDSCEWTVGPATDGGYYMLGCRAASFFPEVFSDIDWGTSRVFAQTCAKIHERKLSLATLPARRDIDFADDLRSHGPHAVPGRLKGLLEQWGWIE